jgi:hypothetical protein
MAPTAALSHPVPDFAWRALAWLVPAFALWYAFSGVQAWLISFMADVLVSAFRPALAAEVTARAGVIEFVTELRVTVQADRQAVLLTEVNSRVHTAGFALYFALVMAGLRWNSAAQTAKALAWGALALLPFQAAGVSFDAVAQAAVRSAYPVALQAGLSSWQREAVALGYQAFTLLGPTLVPAAMWAALNATTLRALTGAKAAHAQG